MTEFIRAPLDTIEASSTNPRKHFDEAKLRELAATITSHGVITPIVIRPHPAQNGHAWQLVSGERRLRASYLAGAADIPAIVEQLTDRQVEERQLIENAAREDLNALEEGSTYQRLIEEHGLSIDELCSRTGRSKSHIYGRLKLTSLAPGPRQALLDGRISSSIAEMVARQPTESLQEALLADIFGTTDGDYDANIQRETITPGLDRERAPLSHRAVQALVHRKYSLRLELASFELGDADLLPSAGACTTCPHRSGNQPELFPDLSRPADVCTKPTCHAEKTAVVWKRAEDQAFERGDRVVTTMEYAVYFGHGNTLVSTAPFVDPAAELPYDLRVGMPMTSKVPTWGKLLGKKHEVPVVLVQDPTGAPREYLDRAAAILALTEAGKIEKPSKAAKPGPGASSAAPKPTPEARAKEKAKLELKESALSRVLAMVADGAGDALATPKQQLAFVRWLLRAIHPLISVDACDAVEARRDDDLPKLIDKAPTLAFALSLLAEMLVSEHADPFVHGSGKKDLFVDGCKLFGADWDKAQALAKAAADAEKKSDAAKKTAPKKAGAK